ncbi:MAG: ABC transporter permease [Terriglobia bacterium]
MGNLWQDLCYGARVLAKNPGFTAVAVLTLALGIGANTAIFSLVNAVIIRPLPYPDPEQLVGLGQWRNQKGEGYIQTGVSAPNAVDIIRDNRVFQFVSYYHWTQFNLTQGNPPETVEGARVSAGLLPMYGVQPLLGRFFSAEEAQPGHEQVAVLGHRLWQMRYGSDPAILGKSIDLDEKRYTVVGVMPTSFRFTWDEEVDVLVPLALSAEELSEAGRTDRGLETLARLKPGVSVPQAQAAMDTLARHLEEQYPDADKGWGIKVEPLHDAYHRHVQTPLLIMVGAVLFVLLIACANVANLLLARATGRRREIAIRLAMGAGRRRLIGQLIVESLLLAVLGGALGLFLAYGSDRLLTLGLNRYFTIPNAKVVDLDWRVLLFSLGITFATGFIFGLAPSLAASRTDLNESLKESGLSTTTESGRRRLRNALVVSEIALALVLLTGAGLLVRTFLALMNVDLGIDPAHVLTMGISLPRYKYSTATEQTLFYQELFRRLESTPGVKAAGAQGGGADVFFQPEGLPPAPPGQEPTAEYDMITPGYLRAMGIGLVAGREFSESDAKSTTPVALINETVAQRYWPHSSPVGRHLSIGSYVYRKQSADTPTLEVVGVVKDVRGYELWAPEPHIYIPYQQHPVPGMFLAVRTAMPPMSMATAVESAVLAVDKQQPTHDVRTMEDIVSETYGFIRFPMTLVWIFAALALLLSAVGIFGVMSYTVSRRTREMAIRMALGAGRRQVLGLVLREGLAVILTGVGFGLAAALGLSRVIAGYVYGIKATDPLTFAASALLLIVVALLAGYIPARRAMDVDPMTALRYE